VKWQIIHSRLERSLSFNLLSNNSSGQNSLPSGSISQNGTANTTVLNASAANASTLTATAINASEIPSGSNLGPRGPAAALRQRLRACIILQPPGRGWARV